MSQQVASSAASFPQRILAQGKYETLAMLKNGEQLLLNIAFPLFALVGLRYTGFLDSYAQQLGVTRLDIAVPGVLALCVISTALSGQGIATGFDRRYGVLRFLSTTPLGKTGLMMGKILAVLTVIVVQYLIVLLVAVLLGFRPHLIPILLSIPTLLCGAAAFTALGMLIAGTVRAEATLAIVNMAWAILAIGGGTLIPTHHFPGILGWIVNILPSGALGSALRGEYLHQEFLFLPHLVMLVWALLCGSFAAKFFKWSA